MLYKSDSNMINFGPIINFSNNHKTFGASSESGSAWGTSSYFFLKSVGINAKKAKANKVMKLFELIPIF